MKVTEDSHNDYNNICRSAAFFCTCQGKLLNVMQSYLGLGRVNHFSTKTDLDKTFHLNTNIPYLKLVEFFIVRQVKVFATAKCDLQDTYMYNTTKYGS